jgi:hypothetical protein
VSDLVVVCLEELPGESGESWRECADVLYSMCRYPAADAWRMAGHVLRRYPGCVLVLIPRTDGGCVVLERLGFRAGASAGPRGGARPAH